MVENAGLRVKNNMAKRLYRDHPKNEVDDMRLTIPQSALSDYKNSITGALAVTARAREAAFVRFADKHAVTLALAAYTIVFIWFGGVKLFPTLESPVYTPVGIFVEGLGLPVFFEFVGIPYNLKAILMFIGAYEIFLGILFATRRIRLAIPVFFVHQGTALLSLLVAPQAFFGPPFLQIGGLSIPWMQGAFSAYVLKNLVFIGGFFLLVSRMYGDRT